MSGYLLDTNVISELTRPEPAVPVVTWLEAADERLLYLSVLTLGEIRQGVRALVDSSRRARLETWLWTELPARFAGRLLNIDAPVADRWGQLAGDARRLGNSVPVVDGMLAATALVHELTLVTRNIRDFAACGIQSLNPWESG